MKDKNNFFFKCSTSMDFTPNDSYSIKSYYNMNHIAWIAYYVVILLKKSKFKILFTVI